MFSKSGLNIKTKKQFILLLIVLLLLIITGVYFYYNSEKDAFLQYHYIRLKSISDFEENQIESWIKERTEDIKVTANSPFFKAALNRWLSDTGNANLKFQIMQRLQIAEKEYGYENILLAKPNGRLVLSLNSEVKEFENATRKKIIEVSIKPRINYTDLYWSLVENKALFDILAPITDNNNKLIAVLIFRCDPDSYLYPLLQTGKTAGRSSETIIYRKENDSLQVLNELRFKTNAALKLKIPLTKSEIAGKAESGKSGLTEGKDYRGVEVVADVRLLPYTKWIMITKIDKSEIYSALYYKVFAIGGFLVFFVVIIAAGYIWYYNSRQRNIYKELYNKEKELWQNQVKFEITMDSLGEGVITTNLDGKVQYMNNTAETLTGWKSREARGRPLQDVYPVVNEETGKVENNILDKVLKKGVIKELANHTILISKYGKNIPVLDTGSPILDSDGSTIGIVIAFQDETEKRKQSRLLKESENRLRSTMDNMMEGGQIIGFDYRYLYLNKIALQQSRSTKENLLGKTMMECYPGIENTEMFSRLKLCMEKRITQKMENKFTYPDGSSSWFNISFAPVPEGVFILSEDITQQKKSEEEIKKLSRAVEQSPVSVLITDPAGNIDYVNDGFCRMTGYTKSEVIGKNPRLLKSGHQDKNFYQDMWEAILSGKEWRGDLQNKRKDGTLYWESVVISPLVNEKGDVTHFVAVQEDITEIKKSRESLQLFRTLIEQSNDSVEVVDLGTGRVVDCNEKAFKQLGYTREEFLALKVFDYDKNLNKDKFADIINVLRVKGSLLFETSLRRKNNSEFPVEINIKYVKHDKEYALAVVRDITERKKAEVELKLSEEKYRNLVDNALIGVYESNIEGELTFANRTILSTLGLYSLEDLKGVKIPDIFVEPSGREKFLNALKENGYVTNYEIDLNIKGKELLHALVSARLSGNTITGMILDITEKKNAENAIIEAKVKAEEMNRLKNNFLANMSHELRTPLIGIMGYAEFLEEEIKDRNLAEMVKVIKKSGKRLNKTLNALLDISKIESEHLEINLEKRNLLDLLNDQVKLFKITAEEKGISLNFIRPNAELYSTIDELLFSSIIDNILNNAIKFTNKGSVEIKAERVNDNAVIKIKDTGIGIPEDSLEIIFQPFRQASEGLNRKFEGVGLGLSIVKKCTELLGGTVTVKSKVNEGSIFTLVLPLIK